MLADTFLESAGRNSNSTKATYSMALKHFSRFLKTYEDAKFDIENIVSAAHRKKVNVYKLLDAFVSYLQPRINSPKSIIGYVTAVRSYFQYNDIEIIPYKFKHQVNVPKAYQEDEQPIDIEDTRLLLKKCTNPRLKAFILILASSGLRAGEACALRYQDVDFNTRPTKIHVRKEYNKTRTARDVYISDEATSELVDVLRTKQSKEPNRLIFAMNTNVTPRTCYNRLASAFRLLLEKAQMNRKKEGSQRHEITLHSFRRMVFTIVEVQAGFQYANWLIGHSNSTYWRIKEPEKRKIYQEQCMKHLTYLDFSLLEKHGRSIEFKLQEKDQQIEQLNKQMAAMEQDHRTIMELLQDGGLQLKRKLDEEDNLVS